MTRMTWAKPHWTCLAYGSIPKPNPNPSFSRSPTWSLTLTLALDLAPTLFSPLMLDNEAAATFWKPWWHPLQFREILLVPPFTLKLSYFHGVPYVLPWSLYLDLSSLPSSFGFTAWLGNLGSDVCSCPVEFSWVPSPQLYSAWVQCCVTGQASGCVVALFSCKVVSCQASLSFTISQTLLKLRSIELMMPSNRLILCPHHPSPPALNLSQHQGLFQWDSSLNQVAKVLEFSINPSNEYSGLISFRIDWFDLLPVQGILKSLLQHHGLKTSVLWCSAFFMVQLSHMYMTFGKTIALYGTLLAKWCLCLLIWCLGFS